MNKDKLKILTIKPILTKEDIKEIMAELARLRKMIAQIHDDNDRLLDDDYL